jgi:hypothetical protein
VNDPSTTGARAEPSSARIEVDPMHVVVSGTYADSSVDVLRGTLDEDLTITFPDQDDAVLRMATGGVVLVATDGLMLVALGVDETPEAGRADPPAPLDTIELIGRARQALESAERAFSRVVATSRGDAR